MYECGSRGEARTCTRADTSPRSVGRPAYLPSVRCHSWLKEPQRARLTAYSHCGTGTNQRRMLSVSFHTLFVLCWQRTLMRKCGREFSWSKQLLPRSQQSIETSGLELSRCRPCKMLVASATECTSLPKVPLPYASSIRLNWHELFRLLLWTCALARELRRPWGFLDNIAGQT